MLKCYEGINSSHIGEFAWNNLFFFFAAVGNTLGSFVCIDDVTSQKKRLDVGRMLIVV